MFKENSIMATPNHFSLHKVVALASLLFIATTLITHQHSIGTFPALYNEEDLALSHVEEQLPVMPLISSLDQHKPTIIAPQPEATSPQSIATKIDSPHVEQVIVRKNDTISQLFDTYHIDQSVLHTILTQPAAFKVLTHLQPTHTLKLTFDDNHQLDSLSYEISPLTRLMAKKDKLHYWQINQEKIPLVTKVILAGGSIKNNLYQGGKEAHLPDKIISELASIFGWQMDFARDIHQGDYFSVLYEMQYSKDKPIAVGPIVAAEINIRGQVHKAIRYTPAGSTPSYYSPEGKNLHSAFLRYPIKYVRISSPFDPNRRHPILKYVRPHWGVDLAAPRGTPIHAAGAGKIVFSGKGAGYGNHVILKHGATYSTLYAHMSRIANNIVSGKTVQQGQVIGYVGSTGLATGPHLHYEFRIHGQRVNPVTYHLPQGKSLSLAELTNFKSLASQQLAKLDTLNAQNHDLA